MGGHRDLPWNSDIACCKLHCDRRFPGKDIALGQAHNDQSRRRFDAARNDGDSIVDKCQQCQFYDRQNVKPNDGKATQWGQCRRNAPMLHPINAKSYMIEGVWPHVRDDDWCGEWKMVTRRLDTRVTEVSTGPLLPGHGAPASTPSPMMPSMPPRPSPMSAPTSISASPSLMPLPGVAMSASGRGN
jgi:hypothetical protein